MATYVTATALGCLHKRGVAVRSEHIRPHYVYVCFRHFLYWHKRNGGGGWSVAAFCCYAWVGLALWLCSEAEQAMCQKRGEHSHKKYDS